MYSITASGGSILRDGDGYCMVRYAILDVYDIEIKLPVHVLLTQRIVTLRHI